MLTVRLKDLLNEFEEWVIEGRAKKIPYHEWRFLKQHEDDQVRIERDGWGDLGIFSETCCKFLVEGWAYDDGSFGSYLDTVYINEFDNDCYSNWYNEHKNTGYYSKWRGESVGIDSDVSTVETYTDVNGQTVMCTINEKVNEAIGLSINRKENDSMNNLFKGFDFGSCENDNVKVSMYGIAVKNANSTWVSYDPKSGNVIDVDILNFDAKYLYKMPVAIKDVKPGDVVIHNRKPMFVVNIDGSKLDVIDPAAGEEKIVLLTKSMFGFDFVTKVVNFLGNISAGASEDAPFGNILPLMLLADGGKSDDMLPLMFLANGGGNFDMSNPMMLYFLMKNGGKSNDMLPLYFFMNGSYLGAPNAKTCNCGCNNADA